MSKTSKISEPGELRTVGLRSRCLRGNALGNSTDRGFTLYRAPDSSRGAKTPCVMFLSGYGSGPLRQLEKDLPMHRLLDLLILGGEIPACNLICPDGMTLLGGSQYLDSDLNGPFEQHLIREVLPAAEKVLGGWSRLWVMGHSSGGFGALQLASKHPGLFQGAASCAGDMHFELTHKHMLADLVNDLRSGCLGSSLKECRTLGKTSYTLGLCAAYSPNLSNRKWKVDFPIDIESGELVEKVWERWRSFDPVEWVGKRRQSLLKLEKIVLSCGEQDQHALHLGADLFAKRCRDRGIAVTNLKHRGDHKLLLRQMEACFKALLLSGST